MTKKKTMKNIKTPNKFWDGGVFMENFRKGFSESIHLPDGSGFKDMFSAANMGKALGTALPGITGTLGGVAGGLISDGFSTTGGQVLSGIGDAAMMFNPIIGGAIKAASGLVNRGFGTKWNQEGLAKAEGQITDLNNFQSGASDYDTLAQDFTRIGSMNKTIKASDLGKDGWFVNRTTNKANELNTYLGNAYNYAIRNANNVADNIAGNTLANLERNYAAFGGPLFAYGGHTHGADFTNGLMFINNGGTHESNPYEGVPISMDQEGNPNLVEEGEVIWNEYVFSNRLKVPKSIQKKYKLGKKEITFANAIDKLSKESEERPNDPISMRGLEDILMHMAIEQETIKSKKQNKKVENNKFAIGGPTSGLSWFQDPNGNYYQEYLDAVNNLTKQQYIDYIKRSTGRDVAYTDQEFNKIKAGMTDGKYGQKHIDMYNIIQSQPLNVKTVDTSSLVAPVKPLEAEPLKFLDKKTLPWMSPTLNDSKGNISWMRYAPIVGSAVNIGTAFAQKPDYSNANAIINAANTASTPIKFTPIGDYMTYNPFDTEYYANQLRSVAGATRRNVMNTSGGNRATAMAGVLTSDNNTMNQMGNLYRTAAEYNLDQRQKVSDFNRATNMYNSDGLFKADAQNQQARMSGLDAIMRGYLMKEDIASNLGKTRSAALTGLFNNMGNIGIDNANRAERDMLIRTGAFGTLSEKPNEWSEDKWKNYQTFINSR